MKTFSAMVVMAAVLVWATHAGFAATSVDVAAKPGGTWKKQPTRTLEDLPADVQAKSDQALTAYGGRSDRRGKATGFFHAELIGGRWWLVDPEGGLFVHKAVVSVAPLRTTGAQAVWREKFGNDDGWAAQTMALLREHGFNGTGAWTDTAKLRATAQPPAYTLIWNFMSSYGKKRGGTYQKPGHTGYPKDSIFVFDPEFEVFCQEHAQQLAATKDDPRLVGHFTDNELPFKREALANYLALPEGDAGHRAAAAWLRARHGAGATAKDITEQDQQDFLGVVAGRYFEIVARAIRRVDPNHLVLGSRLHGAALRFPEVFKAAGPHLDVVAINYYNAWTPVAERMDMWVKESGRPFLITEWYAKGMDSGMANTSGAGWTVKTQADRGRFYENFTLGLLEARGCVGWHWFKYVDNDPADTKADPSNTDSNKGIVSNRYVPYAPLLASMKRINERAYGVIDHFDAVATRSGGR